MARVVQPPQAIDAEQIILGNVINNPDKFFEISAVITSADIFYDETHQLLRKKIKELVIKNEPFDMVSIANQLSEKEKQIGITPYYLTEITSRATEAQNVTIYSQILHKKYLMRLSLIHI